MIEKDTIQSQAIATESSEDIISAYRITLTERIVRNIAHEIRNPLTNVMLGVDQLKNELSVVDESAEVYFSIIQRNCERINHLITNLVDAAKQTELILEDHSINQLIDEVLSISHTKLKDNQIRIIKSFSEDIPPIQLDGIKIRSAFENLIQNAIHAMQNKQGVLEIETLMKGQKCIVNIKDNGVGIEQEYLSRVFDPFFRMRSNGTGLGLTTTQNIINTHKGQITVESNPGKGSVFSISLNCSA